MNTEHIWTVLATIAALISTGCSVYIVFRDRAWRDSEEFKALQRRIEAAEKALAAGEERFKNLATKADLSEVKSDLRGVERSLEKVDAATIRIERILMGEKL